MLIIRQEQLDALRDAMQRGFEDEALAHLQQYFPAETAAQSEEQLRAFIAVGKEHARSYGVEATNAMLCFIDVRFVLGDAFDTDPALAWVAAPLRDPFLPDGEARVEELAQRAAAWVARTKAGS